MTFILPVRLGDGSDAVLEIEADRDEQGHDLNLIARDGNRLSPAAFTLAAAMDNVVPVLDRIITRVRQTARRPDEIAVELGLKIGGEHGVILTKGTAEANVKLTVKWISGDSRRAGAPPTSEDEDTPRNISADASGASDGRAL
ncbi:CU044_2847 family protein [Actinoplanes sp. CA-030573]|uniref:CU044_2847 family protein n=1 Tax=Actinoplanes sp. CA-030573 TaxID=3239898 RepID=UPI003D8C71A0